MRLILASFVLVGCGSKDPMTEGRWLVSVDNVGQNTCPLDDSDVGVGESEIVNLLWESDTAFSITLQSDPGTPVLYNVVGDSAFSRTSSDTVEIEDPCFLEFEFDYRGSIVTDDYATAENNVDLTDEGDCSDYDTTGLPCSYVLEVSWSYLGE